MKNFYKFLFFIFCISSYSQVTNTFLAGSWECGNSEGITGSPATFSKALGIATDSNGNVYVADTDANIIRKITPDGSYVSTIAGTNGVSGNTDGIGTAAKFFKPKALAVDPNGNIYVADTGNNRIRKITPSGVVTTLAGSTPGYANGLGSAAKFNNITGLALDEQGALYVVDRGDQTPIRVSGRIRKIDPNGLVSNIYSPGTSQYFFNPYGITKDSSGNFYISESTALGSSSILKINSTGTLLNTNSNLGQGQTCIGNITIDSADNLYLTCHSNLPDNLNSSTTSQIRKITPTGYVSNVVTSGLYNALGLAIKNNGDLIIADSWNYRILKYDTLGILTNFAGPDLNSAAPSGLDGLGFVTLSHFNRPSGIVSDSNGNIYVADTGNNRIRKITPSGVVTTFTGSTAGYLDGNLSQAKFNMPVSITIDANNNIYLAEMYGTEIKIRKINISSGIVSTIHTINSGGSSLNGGIVVDNNNNVFITFGQGISKISSSGVFSEFVGSWNWYTSSAGNLDGIGTNAKFNNPRSLTSDLNGNIYVADFGNRRIRKVTPSGVVTTLAINANLLFDQIAGITYYSGVIYVNEYEGVIKKINSLQEVYLVCNQANSGTTWSSNLSGINIVNNDIVFAVGCSIKKIANQVLEIDQNAFTNNEINLFPNPAKDQITIDLSSNLNLIGGNYKILNMLGQEVLNGVLSSQQNIIALNNIKGQGVYFVKIYDSSNSLLGTKKIIIQE